MKVTTISWDDDSVDLAAFTPGAPVTITKPDGTSPVTGGKVLTEPFRVASLPPVYHEHPFTGATDGPEPTVDG